MSLHHTENHRGRQGQTDPITFSRRDVCKGLGVMGVALLLGGCEGFPRPSLAERPDGPALDPAQLPPEQFSAKVGTVESARASAATGIESPNEFLQRFLAFSPRVRAAGRSGGPIGSVLYNPTPAAIASAVTLQLGHGRGEPEMLHNDLGKMAAFQYIQYGPKTFAGIFPSSVSLVGDEIHKDRSLLQLVISGNLPSAKIVCVNQDMENLIGRQVTFATQIVHGIQCGAGLAPIRGAAIWTADRDTPSIPEGTVSLELAGALIRLQVAGEAVKAITPTDRRVRPTGWQSVSDAYRNFAVGQLIEAEQAVALQVPRNAYEKAVISTALGEYRPYLADVKERLDWGHTCLTVYGEQKQDGRADLLLQPIFTHKLAARKQL